MTKDQTKEIYDVKGTVDAAQSCKVSHICSLAKGGVKWKEERDAFEAKKNEIENDFKRLKEDWEKGQKPEDKLKIIQHLAESIRVKEGERDLGIEKQKVIRIQALMDAKDEKINELQKELSEKRSMYDADPELRRVEHRIKVLTKELKEKETELALKESNLNALDDHARYLTDKVRNDRAICKDIYQKVQDKRIELQKIEKQTRKLSGVVVGPKSDKRGGQKRNPFKRLWLGIRRREE